MYANTAFFLERILHLANLARRHCPFSISVVYDGMFLMRNSGGLTLTRRLEALRKAVPHAENANTASFLEEILHFITQLKHRVSELEASVSGLGAGRGGVGGRGGDGGNRRNLDLALHPQAQAQSLGAGRFGSYRFLASAGGAGCGPCAIAIASA